MAVRDDIRVRFQDNLGRVRIMVQAYESSAGKGKGRRSVKQTDLLRAAVVLLHATLEDLLRSVCEWKMPSANPEVFSDVPLVGTRGKTRFGMQELASFRGHSVDEVIDRSVSEFLESSSFNHPGNIKEALERAGLDSAFVSNFGRSLAPMMSRRHLIAHRADRNPSKGPGHHPATSLGNATVTHWAEVVQRFGDELLSRV
jgi:hypothetical protein